MFAHFTRYRTLALLLGLCLCDLGCSPAKAAIDSQRILGKWEGGMGTLEFFSNGEVREYALLRTNKGTWTMPGDNRLKLDMEGIFYGSNKVEFKYELSSSALKLVTLDGNIKLDYKWKE